MAKISFLLPVYNAEEFLAETLNSLMRQDFDDYEILVVNDGSTDRTSEILDSTNSKRLRVFDQENGGLVSALNNGLDQIDSDYVARIDADDICFPHRLTSQLEFVEFTGADIVSCAAIDIDDAGNTLGITRHNNELFSPDATFLPAKEPYLPHPFLFGRRDVFAEVGGYRNAHLAEDSDLYWRMQADYKMALQRDPLGLYRVHSGSVSNVSVTAGRVQAFYSQLAALNTQRRDAFGEEVAYVQTMAEAKACETIEDMLAIYSDQLSAEERKWLQAASYAKLLDLSGWRGHELKEQEVIRADAALSQIDLSFENKEKLAQIRARRAKAN